MASSGNGVQNPAFGAGAETVPESSGFKGKGKAAAAEDDDMKDAHDDDDDDDEDEDDGDAAEVSLYRASRDISFASRNSTNRFFLFRMTKVNNNSSFSSRSKQLTFDTN